jgi:hypothetical protein
MPGSALGPETIFRALAPTQGVARVFFEEAHFVAIVGASRRVVSQVILGTRSFTGSMADASNRLFYKGVAVFGFEEGF